MHLDYYTKGQTLVLLLVVLLISIGSQYYFNGSSSTPAVSSILPTSSVKAVPIPFGTGEIVSISSGYITLAISQTSPAVQLKLAVSQATKIQEGNKISASESATLMQDYIKRYMKDGFGTPLPELFTSTKSISLSSLKPGDTIAVFFSGAIDPNTNMVSVAMITRVLQ